MNRSYLMKLAKLQDNFDTKQHLVNVDKRIWLVLCAIFLLGLYFRAVDLGTGLTNDERHWLVRSPNFINAILMHDWINTYQAPHPGVITMWVSGTLLKLMAVSDFPLKLSIGRTPIVLVTSIAILLIFYFVKLLFNTKIALLSAATISLDPYLIAHSRLIHLDAMLSTLMILSVLAFIAFLNNSNNWLLVSSGIFAGIALLTKMPAGFLVLFIPFISAILIKDRTRLIKCILIFGSVCAITFFLLWPAMWVDPINTIGKMVLDKGSGLEVDVTGTHENNSLLFYPFAFLSKTTPLILLSSLLCIGILVKGVKEEGFTSFNKKILILLMFMILFTAQMEFASKTSTRYLLPVFPAVDILAGIGIYSISKEYIDNDIIFYILILAVIIMQTSLLVPISPYFLSYSNPIKLGSHASGWGEGNDLAAEYLNNKPDARNLTVIAQYTGFEEYFHGRTISLWGLGIKGDVYPIAANYVVFYRSTVKRNLNENLWNFYKNKTAEKIIKLNGLDYCWIYKIDSTDKW